MLLSCLKKVPRKLVHRSIDRQRKNLFIRFLAKDYTVTLISDLMDNRNKKLKERDKHNLQWQSIHATLPCIPVLVFPVFADFSSKVLTFLQNTEWNKD